MLELVWTRALAQLHLKKETVKFIPSSQSLGRDLLDWIQLLLYTLQMFSFWDQEVILSCVYASASLLNMNFVDLENIVHN